VQANSKLFRDQVLARIQALGAIVLIRPPALGVFTAVAVVLVAALCSATASAQETLGFFAGAGPAATHSSGEATGSFDETESANALTLRLDAGVSTQLGSRFALALDAYAQPLSTAIGRGDSFRAIYGAALRPALGVTSNTQFFASLGYERAHTNSPVPPWYTFESSGVTVGLGVARAFHETRHSRWYATARVERTRYADITVEGQTDSLVQVRLIAAVEVHLF